MALGPQAVVVITTVRVILNTGASPVIAPTKNWYSDSDIKPPLTLSAPPWCHIIPVLALDAQLPMDVHHDFLAGAQSIAGAGDHRSSRALPTRRPYSDMVQGLPRDASLCGPR